MNAELKMLDLVVPQHLLRRQPARFGWWSDETLMIVKGEDVMTLDADDISALARFVDACGAGEAL